MSVKRKGIILDYDDVLVNYCNGVVEYAYSHYGLKPKFEPNSYNLEKTFDVNSNLISNILHNFNNNSYQFGLLDIIDDHVKGCISMLRDCYPEVDLFIVTKCGNSSKTVALRRVNAINHFGKDAFEDILFLNPDETKASAFNKLKKTHDIVCVVDDHIDNIKTAQECGLSTLVYERNHNVNYKGDHRFVFAKNWIDVYYHLEQMMK